MKPKRLDQIQLTPRQQVSLSAALRRHAEWWRASAPDGEQAVDFEAHMCAPWDQMAERILQVPRIEPGQVEQLSQMFNTQEIGWYAEPDFAADQTPAHMDEIVNAMKTARGAGDAPGTPAEPGNQLQPARETTPEVREQWSRLQDKAREAVATARYQEPLPFTADNETGAWDLVHQLDQQIEEFEAEHGVVREAHARVIEVMQAAAGGQIVLTELGDHKASVQPRRPGAGYGTELPEVTLSRWVPESEGAHLTVRREGVWAAATDTQAAAALGVEVSTWAACRDAIETGLATELGLIDQEPPERVLTSPSLYPDLMARSGGDPAAQIMLGVTGNETVDQRERMAMGIAIRESWAAADDAAYANHAGHTDAYSEPGKQMPFGLRSLIRAGGNLEHALADPDVRQEVADRLDLSSQLIWIADEDGEREGWTPDLTRTPDGQRQIAGELDRIARSVGVESPTERAVPVSASATSSAQPAPDESRPPLLPPGLSARRRPEERDLDAPGQATGAPGLAV